ncbi:WD40-repeat-containing domain protein [Obelidium mucronatum]|nr:WD40-repeat-containing domain protein [Obelidium mucronatum]
MRTFLTWSDNINDRDGNKLPIYDLTFKPDGSQLIVGAGTEVLVYDVAEGELIQSLKAHKDNVYAVDYSADGTRFASGGADKQVIIWSAKMEGILKYSHSDSIQSLSHNPVTGQVISCTASDFGLWSPEQKSVTKHKVPARILTSSWTNDGQFFALGLFNGHVSIRSRSGEEKVRIERSAPVWSLQWCPSTEKESELLAITDWNQKLAFFQINGRQVGKERTLGYDPSCVSFFSSGDFAVVGGSDQKVTLWTAEGIKLGVVCEKESWVWCCKVKPKQNYVAVGCNDGSISLHQIVFNTVHGLYNDRYAFRENMTDVVIQHLVTDQRARIKCRDYVKKIAVYKDRLAVQLPDRIIIYELFHDDATDMHYRIKEKLQKKLDCNLLVVTSQHIILCLEKKLQMYQFNGDKEREWNLDSLIRYIKTIGGPKGQEGLLVGMKNGQIFQVFLNNPFPIPLIKQQTPVRCLDLNLSRTRLAVVDDHNVCLVYCLKTKELLFQEPNANSVAWNSELDDMLCYSGNGVLNVKTGAFLSHQQKMQGFVVGFKGSRIFCLHIYNMTTVDVPQSTSLERYLDKKEFEPGYKVACLGVTESDWRRLAMDSLEGLNFDVARKAFVRLRDTRFLDLIKLIDRMKNEGKYEMDNVIGEINTYVGKFHEAARLFKRAGNHVRAIQMYTELNMWEYATQIAAETNMDPVEILKRKAQTQQDRNDLIAAASTYIEVGDYLQAINIIGPSGAVDKLIEITRKLKKSDSKALSRCLYYFRKYNHHPYAAECLIKMGDITHLLSLHIELMQWEEAFRIAETYPEYSQQIYLPYATWLAMNDRYMEAQVNYRKAGRVDEAIKVLERLGRNSVTEWRFNDASYYYHLLSMENLQTIPNNVPYSKLSEAEQQSLHAFERHRETSQVYFAFYSIRKFIDEPFTSHLSESLLSMAAFLLNQTMKQSCPPGVSKAYILYALTKISRSIGAFKLARYGYERLQNFKIPSEWENLSDLSSLTIRGKPAYDRDDLLPVCYVCSTANPMLNAKGDHCIECKERFVRSMYSFQILPLAEFVLADGISDIEAASLISKEPTTKPDNLDLEKRGKKNRSKMTPEHELNRQIDGLDRSGSVLRLDKSDLAELRSRDVFIQDWGKLCLEKRYYKVSHADASIVMCPCCQHFFMDDEWNYQYLQEGACHFCRSKVETLSENL